MRVGIIVPQGWTGEYDGWDPARAWARTVAVAHEAEALGFDSLWLFDHFQTEPVPTDEITFEAFVGLSALAVETARVRLGHLVLCAGYRNPALVAKMISTLDVVSGGRAELALGAGWKEDEYTAYGFGFAPLKELMDNFVKAGGHIYVCSPCFKKRKLDENNLVAGAAIVGGAKLVEFLSDGSPCVSY